MWTSSQMKMAPSFPRGIADVGVVTAGGARSSVYTGSEHRRLPVMAPGGYRWCPQTGEQVLVMKTGADGESPFVLAQQLPDGDNLLPGEVELAGPGCGVKLAQRGQIAIQGTVSINGCTLEDMIRSIVTAAIAQHGG